MVQPGELVRETVMLDGLPQNSPGRYSAGSWGSLILAVVFGVGAGGALYWLLSQAAEIVKQA